MTTPDALLALAQTDALSPLPPTTPPLATILSSPPFVPIPGTFNARDLGLVPGSPVRPGLVYRSGGFPEGVPAGEGGAALAGRLRVRRVFDLRTAWERERRPGVRGVEGVETVWAAPGEGEVLRMEAFERGEGEDGVAAMYMDVLRLYREGIRGVLAAVRDGGGEEALLFHCNAGRDRTGVVAGLLLTLAGASAETIAFDYVLSRIGIEPAREQLLDFVLKGPMAASVDSPGFKNMSNLRASCWEAFVKAVEAEYGGFEGYVRGTLGFSDEDIAKIKTNLVLPN